MAEEALPFAARISFPDRETPVRAYIHKAGLSEVYESVDNAIDYFNSQLNSTRLSDWIGDFEYAIPIVWGNDRDNSKIIDVFAYSDVADNWPGNPDVTNFLWYNGEFKRSGVNEYLSNGVPSTCGDSLIVLGLEEKWRRQTPNLAKYIASFPYSGELSNLEEATFYEGDSPMIDLTKEKR